MMPYHFNKQLYVTLYVVYLSYNNNLISGKNLNIFYVKLCKTHSFKYLYIINIRTVNNK